MSAPRQIKYRGQIYRQAVKSTKVDREQYAPYVTRLQKLIDTLREIDQQLLTQGGDADARLAQAKVFPSLEMAQAQIALARTGLQRVIDGKFGRHTVEQGADRT
jgi:chitinase